MRVANSTAAKESTFHGSGAAIMGRISLPPHPTLFRLLYEPSTAKGVIEVLPYLLKIDAAHVVMLFHCGLLPSTTAAQLLSLNRELSLKAKVGAQVLDLETNHRGLYFLYEQTYIERLGTQVGGAAHLARSRNDINATVSRLSLRDALLTFLAEMLKLLHAIDELAQNNVETCMSGFTHLQPSQPITLGHYLAGVLSELVRAAQSLSQCFDTVNSSPMGALAGQGTSFPIDRDEVAGLLGFSSVLANSIDAVASRDYLAQVLSVLAVLGVSLTRLANDMQHWSSSAYGFLDWPDDLVSTSSIMPQKRNGFVWENIRGEAVQAFGSLVNTLTGMKNVPFSNSVEVSWEASAHIWPAIRASGTAVQLTRLLLEKVQVNKEAMLGFLAGRDTTMTALADMLVARYGASFRAAHDAIGQMLASSPGEVNAHRAKAALEPMLSRAQGRPVEIDKDELEQTLDPVACVHRAGFGGGPAPCSVLPQLRDLRAQLRHLDEIQAERNRMLEEKSSRLERAVDEVIRTSECGGHHANGND
jgi:argininosuccinate lyase